MREHATLPHLLGQELLHANLGDLPLNELPLDLLNQHLPLHERPLNLLISNDRHTCLQQEELLPETVPSLRGILSLTSAPHQGPCLEERLVYLRELLTQHNFVLGGLRLHHGAARTTTIKLDSREFLREYQLRGYLIWYQDGFNWGEMPIQKCFFGNFPIVPNKDTSSRSD